MASIDSLFIKCQYCLHLTSATKVLENFEKSHVKQEPKSNYSIKEALSEMLKSNVQMKEHKKISC